MAQDDDKREMHPSYAVATFHRHSGTSNEGLFLGGKNPRETLSLRIHSAEHIHSPYQDHAHPDRLLLEVEMTQLQFAQLLSGMNGEGAPVTLRWFEGKRIESKEPSDPRDAMIESVQDRFKTLREEINGLRETAGVLDQSSIKKGEREALQREIDAVASDLENNLPYMLDCFMETVDKMVAQAKCEIDAYRARTLAAQGGGEG